MFRAASRHSNACPANDWVEGIVLELQARLRTLQRRASAGVGRGAHLLVRMHVLRDVRRRSARQRLPELRRRLRAPPGAAVEESEGRQLPRQVSRWHEGQTPAGGCRGTREVRRADQIDSAGATMSKPDLLEAVKIQARAVIPIVKDLEREIGKERALGIVGSAIANDYAKWQARRIQARNRAPTKQRGAEHVSGGVAGRRRHRHDVRRQHDRSASSRSISVPSANRRSAHCLHVAWTSPTKRRCGPIGNSRGRKR